MNIFRIAVETGPPAGSITNMGCMNSEASSYNSIYYLGHEVAKGAVK
jgi:hypothetical protein